jgi:hypothetical protein
MNTGMRSRINTRTIRVDLPIELFKELIDAAHQTNGTDEGGGFCSPERFAQECIESVLASRRLDRLSA